jgi:hypothetical protein
VARHVACMGPVRNADRILYHLKARDRCLHCLHLKETGCGFGLATVVQDRVQQQVALCEYGNTGCSRGNACFSNNNNSVDFQV